MEKHYYIVARDIAIASARHVTRSSWIDLDATHVLMSVVHKGEHFQRKFEQSVAVEALPALTDTTPVADTHIERIVKHDGLRSLGVKRGMRTRELAALVKRHHIGM